MSNNQISSKRSTDSRFVIDANTKCPCPKSSQSRIVNLKDRGPVKYGVEHRVEYQILADFLSMKVEFLLESGNKSLYFWVIVDSTSICHIRLKYRYST